MARYIYTSVLFIGLILLALETIVFLPWKVSIPDSIGGTFAIKNALVGYAAKHHGFYPYGKNSTEIFQQLIDDHDISSARLYFKFPNKTGAISDKITSENVCFDFTAGTNSKSPSWVPIVFPTGYKTGEAIRLKGNGNGENVFCVGYSNGSHVWPAVTYKWYLLPILKDRINIMPNKPPYADVGLYRQLNPKEGP